MLWCVRKFRLNFNPCLNWERLCTGDRQFGCVNQIKLILGSYQENAFCLFIAGLSTRVFMPVVWVMLLSCCYKKSFDNLVWWLNSSNWPKLDRTDCHGHSCSSNFDARLGSPCKSLSLDSYSFQYCNVHPLVFKVNLSHGVWSDETPKALNNCRMCPGEWPQLWPTAHLLR